MKIKRNLIQNWLLCAALSTSTTFYVAQPSIAFAQGTAFTYQGRLQNNGSPASGAYNLTFSLFNTNTSGVAIAGPVTNNAVDVTNGLFTVLIDFGPGAFTGQSNWLEIAVETNGVNTFTTLAPRQQLTPAPYAIYAESASGLSGILSADQLNSIGNTNGGIYNFFVGPSGNATMSGSDNTAVGTFALQNNASGYYNTANGVGALLLNSSGSCDIADGYAALINNTSGSYNTADGFEALQNNTSGSDNIALGYLAGQNITTGSSNIDIGHQGFSTDTNIIRIGSSQSQTFIAGVINGNGTGLTNLNAFQLTSIGNTNGISLFNFFVGPSGNATTSGSGNTANGFEALYANTSGNYNTANGYAVLVNNTTGGGNTADGAAALNFNTTGSDNTANGVKALVFNTSGSDNTAIGAQALYANTIGGNNTANGFQTLFSNTSGWGNTANGFETLYANTTGAYNTANGFEALYANTSGNYNTANGYAVLVNNTTGSLNTASGAAALNSNTTGAYNTANGYFALLKNTSGSDNIALGYLAGYNITTGSSNIDISNQGVSTDTNIIRIGTSQKATFVAGIYGVTASGGSAVYVNSSGQLGTSTSSRRFKEAIQDMGGQSDVLLALRPVVFRYKPEIDPQGLPQFGLVAEEVEQVDPDLVVHDRDGKPYSVRYEQVNAMLLNEFLRQHRKFEEQNAEMQSLQQENQSLEKRLAELETFVNKLAQTGK